MSTSNTKAQPSISISDLTTAVVGDNPRARKAFASFLNNLDKNGDQQLSKVELSGAHWTSLDFSTDELIGSL